MKKLISGRRYSLKRAILGPAGDSAEALKTALCSIASDLISESYDRGKRGEAAPDPLEIPSTATAGIRDYIQHLNASRALAYESGKDAQNTI